MEKILNIVNGNACIGMMKEAQIIGDFLPWGDFLHEGPVPKDLSLEELSQVRATFISTSGYGDIQEVYKTFQERNRKLLEYNNYDKITLWFEHDLYDQLQLLQVLTWFEKKNLEKITLTLICTNNYLGESTTQQIQKLLTYENRVTPQHLNLAKKAWSAFTSVTPERWFNLTKESTELLPFLKGAIFRMLEEYPNTKCGLSRTQYQTLAIVSNGISDPLDIFLKYQSFEERKFMGDVIFFKILKELEEHKLLSRIEKEIKLTVLGQKVLDGKENWLNIKPIHHFIGGVELTKDKLWCWSVEERNIKPYFYSKMLNSFLEVK